MSAEIGDGKKARPPTCDGVKVNRVQIDKSSWIASSERLYRGMKCTISQMKQAFLDMKSVLL